MQWTGSLLQKKGLDEIKSAGAYYQKVKRAYDRHAREANNPDEIRNLIFKAYDFILEAETSCNFFWGSAWVHKSFDKLEQAYKLLDCARHKLTGSGLSPVKNPRFLRSAKTRGRSAFRQEAVFLPETLLFL